MVEKIDTTVKENSNHKKLLTQSIQEIQDTMKRPNLRIIRIEENKDSQLKEPENVFNKTIEENFPNLKKKMEIKVQEAYKTPNI
jgi:archaeosine-15-forming tRNA-guanine transglycosylase